MPAADASRQHAPEQAGRVGVLFRIGPTRWVFPRLQVECSALAARTCELGDLVPRPARELVQHPVELPGATFPDASHFHCEGEGGAVTVNRVHRNPEPRNKSACRVAEDGSVGGLAAIGGA
jgi:hypothetical protein